MTAANKEQISFIKDCLNVMNDGNFLDLKEIILSTLERLETQLHFSDISDHLQNSENNK